jgi:hypothetical protein
MNATFRMPVGLLEHFMVMFHFGRKVPKWLWVRVFGHAPRLRQRLSAC